MKFLTNLFTVDEAKVKVLGRKGALHLVALQHMTLVYLCALAVRPDLAIPLTGAYFLGVAGLATSFGVSNSMEHFAKKEKETETPGGTNGQG